MVTHLHQPVDPCCSTHVDRLLQTDTKTSKPTNTTAKDEETPKRVATSPTKLVLVQRGRQKHLLDWLTKCSVWSFRLDWHWVYIPNYFQLNVEEQSTTSASETIDVDRWNCLSWDDGQWVGKGGVSPTQRCQLFLSQSSWIRLDATTQHNAIDKAKAWYFFFLSSSSYSSCFRLTSPAINPQCC